MASGVWPLSSWDAEPGDIVLPLESVDIEREPLHYWLVELRADRGPDWAEFPWWGYARTDAEAVAYAKEDWREWFAGVLTRQPTLTLKSCNRITDGGRRGTGR